MRKAQLPLALPTDDAIVPHLPKKLSGKEHVMWGRSALIAVGLLVALLGGCRSKPNRIVRPPDTQYWELPPLNEKQWSEPTTYPEEKPLSPKQKKEQGGIQMPGLRGASGPGGPM